MPSESDIRHAQGQMVAALREKGVSSSAAERIAKVAAENADRRERARQDDARAGRPVGETQADQRRLPTHLLRRG